jgi:hypothetical protein
MPIGSRTKLTVKVPSSTFTKESLVAIARLVDTSVSASEMTYLIFDLDGREFSIEARAIDDLETVDWPDTIQGVRFSKDNGAKQVTFRISRSLTWHCEVSVSGDDLTWTRGTAANFEQLLLKFKSLNGTLSSPRVVIPAAACFWAILTSAITLVEAAAGSQVDAGLVVFAGLLASSTLLMLAGVPGYLFPYVEYEINGRRPTNAKVRKWAAGAFGAFIISALGSIAESTVILAS